MFKVGDIVKYSQKFCGAGEEKYIHKILEINEETGNILIATLNTALTLGCTEVVKAEMIELIENETKEDETMKTETISAEAQELYLYAENDSETYFKSLCPIMENMNRKQAKGTFDPQKAVKAFEYAATFAAQRYCKEFGGIYHKVFTASTRRETAAMILDDYISGSLQ